MDFTGSKIENIDDGVASNDALSRGQIKTLTTAELLNNFLYRYELESTTHTSSGPYVVASADTSSNHASAITANVTGITITDSSNLVDALDFFIILFENTSESSVTVDLSGESWNGQDTPASAATVYPGGKLRVVLWSADWSEGFLVDSITEVITGVGGGEPEPEPGSPSFVWESATYVEPNPTASAGTPEKILATSLGLTGRVSVSNITELNSARTSLPGMQVYVDTTITLSSTFSWTGAFHATLSSSGSDGNSTNPIVITCAPGVYIDGGLTPASAATDRTCVNLRGTRHVGLYGVKVRNCRFGFVSNQSGGDSTRDAIFRHNEVSLMGDSGASFQGHWTKVSGSYGESSYWDIRYNEVFQVGLERPQYGEGIYVGKGNTLDWTSETTHHINIIGNFIHHTLAEPVDVKPGCHNINVDDNLFEDNEAPASAWCGIVLLYADSGWTEPPTSHAPNVNARRNRFTRCGLSPTSNDQLIIIGHKGVSAIGNLGWNNGSNLDRLVHLRSTKSFGNVGDMKVYNNLSFDGTGIHVFGAYDPDGSKQTAMLAATDRANNAAVATNYADYVVSPSDFVGPTTGTADAGYGPGSGFQPSIGGTLDTTGTNTSSLFTVDMLQQPVSSPVKPGPFAVAVA